MSQVVVGKGRPFCLIWGATILTGADVRSAVARRDPGQSNGWCVAPTLSAVAAARLRTFMSAQPRVVLLPLVSHGKVLVQIGMTLAVRSGACWITSDGMTETTARALAAELSGT
jgi:hypothetical protein